MFNCLASTHWLIDCAIAHWGTPFPLCLSKMCEIGSLLEIQLHCVPLIIELHMHHPRHPCILCISLLGQGSIGYMLV